MTTNPTPLAPLPRAAAHPQAGPGAQTPPYLVTGSDDTVALAYGVGTEYAIFAAPDGRHFANGYCGPVAWGVGDWTTRAAAERAVAETIAAEVVAETYGDADEGQVVAEVLDDLRVQRAAS